MSKMESASQVNVPLRSGGKKMRKRRELDALVAHSLAKRANKKACAGNGIHSQDQLLSPSTDEQDDITWPKVVRSSNRTRSRKFSVIQTCIPTIFVMAIALSLGFVYWLHFDLKQQLYEYRSRIEEVSLSSRSVPEELQKLHESSKSLEQNQTILAGRIVEITNVIEGLNKRFAIFEAKLNEKKDFPKDEKVVANFGAEVKGVTADVEHLKDELVEIKKGQTDFRSEINSLKGNFSEVVTNASIRANTNETTDTEKLKKAQVVIFDEIKLLTANLTSVNDTLSQKLKGLTDDQRSQKSQLDGLLERSDNITSHVASIEINWNQKQKVELDSFKNSSIDELQSLKNTTKDLKIAIESVQQDCSRVQKELSQVGIKTENQEDQTAKQEALTDIFGGKTGNSDRNTSANFKSTSPAALASEPTKPTTIATKENNSSTVAVPVPEGKPKLLSIESNSKPV